MAESFSKYSINEILASLDPRLIVRVLSINEARLMMGVRHEKVKKLIREGKIEVIEEDGKIKIPFLNLVKYQQQASKTLQIVDNENTSDFSTDVLKTKLNSIVKKYS